MNCEGCPHPADCAAGRCIDAVIADDVRKYGSLQSATVMNKPQVDALIQGLEAGHAPRTLHALNIVTPGKLKNHLAAWPLWGAQVTAHIAANVKAIHHRRMERRRRQTHCRHGHEYTSANTSWQADGTRQCKTCNRARAALGKALSADEVATIKAKLTAGIPLGWIAGTNGPDQSHYVANFQAVNRARREHSDFDAFVRNALTGANARGQARRHRRIIVARRQSEADHYRTVRALIPAHLPDHVRDDITQDVMVALLEGDVSIAEVRARVGSFVTNHNRMFPPKYAKFGNAQLFSLDEAIFDDGTGSRHDTVSEGLWA